MVKISRRDFIRLASMMGGVSLFAGCSWIHNDQSVPEYIKGAPAVDPIETIPGVATRYSVCALCGGGCGIGCRIAQGALVKIGGNPYHPVSRPDPLAFDTPLIEAVKIGGSVCAIGSSGIQTLYDPFRILKPIKRVGPRGSGKWVAISWEQAISEISEGGNLFGEGQIQGLKNIRSSGVGPTFMAGRTDWGSELFLERFVSSFPRSVFARTNDVLFNDKARELAKSVFGSEFGLLDANYKTAEFLLGFGFTPLDSGQPLVSIARQLADARMKAPCMSWAVVDPRMSTSASRADHWIPIVPGTDARFALAIAKALFEKHLNELKYSDGHLKKLADSWQMGPLIEPCGVDQRVAYQIAGLMAKAGEKSAILFGQNILRQNYGEQTAKLILSLNPLVGSVPGSGALLSQDEELVDGLRLHLNGSNSVTNSPLPNENPALIIWRADPCYDNPEITTKAFLDMKVNPLIISVDSFITQTAAFADYILPDTTYLERWDLCAMPPSCDRPGFGLRSPVVGGFNPKTGDYFPILPGNLIMEDILTRLGASSGLSKFAAADNGKLPNAWGFYREVFSFASQKFNQRFSIDQRNGKTDVFEAVKRGGLFHDSVSELTSGKVKAPEVPKGGDPVKLPSFENTEEDEFLLVTYTLPFHRTPGSGLNSWLLEIIPQNSLVINRRDAEKRNIRQGDVIAVQSVENNLSVKMKAQLAPGIRPGVVAMAKGFGYNGSGAVASMIDGVRSNGDRPRGAGINSEIFQGEWPLKVKINKA